MARCLVTGVAGFIGSSIAESLLSRGFTVRGVDNFSSGKLANVLSLDADIDFTRGDIRDTNLMTRLCKDVDVVFHQAAISSTARSIEDPVSTYDVNVHGTESIIRAAQTAGVRRIVFASTGAIYGDAVTLPSSELDRCKPVSPYAAQKLHAELLLQQAWQAGEVETVCLRYFNVFGPRQYADNQSCGAVAKLVKPMISGGQEHVILCGDGFQTRDFVYIDDVVQASLAAMDGSSRDVAGATFNVGSGCRRSILEAAQLLAALAGYNGPFIHGPRPCCDVQHSVADMQQARRYLNLGPSTCFRDGLAQTVAWMLANTPATYPWKSSPLFLSSLPLWPGSPEGNPGRPAVQ